MVTIHEDLQVMPFNLRILELIGLWGQQGKMYRFWLLFSIVTMTIMFPKATLGIGSSDVTEICKGVAEFIFELSNLVTLVILAAKKESFERVIRDLNECFEDVAFDEKSTFCYDWIVKQNERIKKVFKCLVFYCGYGSVAYCIPAIVISHWRFWNNCAPCIFVLPMEQEFYGLHIRTNFVHYHIFVAILLVASCVCAFFVLVKVTTSCFIIKYSSLTFQLVSKQIKMLPKLVDDNEANVSISDLKQIVELHRKAFKILNMIEDICRIPVAIDTIFCVVFWSLNMFYFSKKFDLNLINVLIIFLLTLVQTFGYSYLGSELAEEAEAVGEAIYGLPWYGHSVELQRYYRLMIQRTQRPTGITGLKFFFVQRTTFSTVIQLSYSYYLVLKDVLNKL